MNLTAEGVYFNDTFFRGRSIQEVGLFARVRYSHCTVENVTNRTVVFFQKSRNLSRSLLTNNNFYCALFLQFEIKRGHQNWHVFFMSWAWKACQNTYFSFHQEKANCLTHQGKYNDFCNTFVRLMNQNWNLSVSKGPLISLE